MGTVTDDLDANLRIAWADLIAAREAWSHSPNSETALLCVVAEARVNRLLERRHTLTNAEAIGAR